MLQTMPPTETLGNRADFLRARRATKTRARGRERKCRGLGYGGEFKHGAGVVRTAEERGAEQISGGVGQQATVGKMPARIVEHGQRGQRVRAGVDLERGPVIDGPAAWRRAVQVAAGVGDQASLRELPVRAIECGQGASACVPAASSNTVPLPFAPPFCVVPYRLPLHRRSGRRRGRLRWPHRTRAGCRACE